MATTVGEVPRFPFPSGGVPGDDSWWPAREVIISAPERSGAAAAARALACRVVCLGGVGCGGCGRLVWSR
jgi:hypothetical protein